MTETNRKGERGRRIGIPNKVTALRKAALENAVEICARMTVSPPQLLAEATEVVRNIALAPIRAANARDGMAQAQVILTLSEPDKDRMIRRLYMASQIAAMLMEFAYPKLARVEHSGAAGGPIEHLHEHSAVDFIESRIAGLAARRDPAGDPSRAN